jgi:hypothetical protein
MEVESGAGADKEEEDSVGERAAAGKKRKRQATTRYCTQ